MRSSSDWVTIIFLTSSFADGKNIQFTIRILPRPSLLITVTETVMKAHGSLQQVIETMEVESGSHQVQTIFLSAHSTLTKVPTVATSISLTITEHTLHRTLEKMFDIKTSCTHAPYRDSCHFVIVKALMVATRSYVHIIAPIHFGIP